MNKRILTISLAVVLIIVGGSILYLANKKISRLELGTSIAEQNNSTATILQVEASRPAIKNLFPTKIGGRTWIDNWDNGKARVITSGKRDPYNSEFIIRGSGSVSVDGKGVATLSGDSPRMYVYDDAQNKKWTNVEVTLYAKRVSETGLKSSQGFVIGARSDHQNVTDTNICEGRTYYGRLLYDGRAVFQKEIVHEGSYSSNKPSETNKLNWGTSDGTMPKNIWIGMKFIVTTNPDGKSVKLQLYRDMTEGKNGGTWQKITEYTDDGGWSQISKDIDVMATCGYSSKEVLLKPGTSVFVRNDMVSNVQYKWFNIREI